MRAGKCLVELGSEQTVFEFVEPWLKDMATDANLTAQLEGLTTLLCFVNMSGTLSNSTLLLGNELIQKCPLTKQKCGELVSSIVAKMLHRDAEATLFGHLIKRFDAKNPKEGCFAMACVRQALGAIQINDTAAKHLFEAVKKAMGHHIAEVRTVGQLLAADFYCYLTEPFELFVGDLSSLKPLQLKEIRDLLCTREKGNIKWSLGLSSLKKDDEDLLLLDDSAMLVTELNSLLPDGFIKIPYITDIKQKRELIRKLNANIDSPGLILGQSDHSQAVISILHILEANNSIIYSEAFKTLEILIPKIPKSFAYKAKQFVYCLADKFKEKKKKLISKANSLISSFREHKVVQGATLVDWVVEIVATHKVLSVKEYALTWIINELQLTSSAQIDLLSGNMQIPKRWVESCLKHLKTTVCKRLIEINNRETQASTKEITHKLLKTINNLSSESAPPQTIKQCNIESLNVLESRDFKKTSSLIEGDTLNRDLLDLPIRPLADSFLADPNESVLPPSDQGFTYDFTEIPERYKVLLFELIAEIRELPSYLNFKKSGMSSVLSRIEQLGPDGNIMCQSIIVHCCSWVFYNISWITLGARNGREAISALFSIIRSIIKQTSVIQEHLILTFFKLFFQAPAFLSKKGAKQIENGLDDLLTVSNSSSLFEQLAEVLCLIKRKKPRITQEDRALVSLKFFGFWVSSRLSQYKLFIPTEQTNSVISLFQNITEDDTPFSSNFMKELQYTKSRIIESIKGAADHTPNKPFLSKSPSIEVSPIPPRQFSPITMETNLECFDFNVTKIANSTSLVAPDSLEIQEILPLLQNSDISVKSQGLNFLQGLIENTLDNSHRLKSMKLGSWRRGMGRLNNSELPTPCLNIEPDQLSSIIQDIIRYCTKYKSYSDQPKAFQQLQELALSTLTSLRTVISDAVAEGLFSLLLLGLPLNYGTSDFVSTFNANVYQLFSDWMSNLPLRATTQAVDKILSTDSQSNIHLVFPHYLNWTTRIELVNPFEIEDISIVLPRVLQALGGIPLKHYHPLAESAANRLKQSANEFVETLVSNVSLGTVKQHIKETLGNDPILLGVFKDWISSKRRNSDPLTIRSHSFQLSLSECTRRDNSQEYPPTLSRESSFIEPANLDSSRKLLNLDEPNEKQIELANLLQQKEKEQKCTQELLEAANREYLTQVAINQELLRELQEHNHITMQTDQKNSSPPEGARRLALVNIQKPSKQHKNIIQIFDPPALPLSNYEGVIDFQHLLLHSTDETQEITVPLLTAYARVNDAKKKEFLIGLTEALENVSIVTAASNSAVKAVLEAVLKFCVSEKLSSEPTGSFLVETWANADDLELTNMLQKILGLLLEAKDPTLVMNMLIVMICESLPLSFTHYIEEPVKIYCRLGLKCLMKLVSAVQRNQLEIRVFDIMIELNKLFEKYPPEKLTGDCPSVGEYEQLFRSLRTVSDTVMSFSPNSALEFLHFIIKAKRKSIFISYVEATLLKKYQVHS